MFQLSTKIRFHCTVVSPVPKEGTDYKNFGNLPTSFRARQPATIQPILFFLLKITH